MKANVGSTERTIRIVLGVAIIGAGLYFQSWWGAIGIIPLVTGAVSFCPLWTVFGINTCKVKS